MSLLCGTYFNLTYCLACCCGISVEYQALVTQASHLCRLCRSVWIGFLSQSVCLSTA